MKGILDRIQDYQKEVLGALVLVVAATGGIYYYRQSRLQREAQAHVALSETLQEFNKALRDQSTWEEVSLAAQTGYQQYKSSSLAPYFLSLQADAAVHKGDIQEARKLMDIVVHEVPLSSPLYYPLKLKYARMLLDSTDENLSTQGLRELEGLTKASAQNTIQDAAFYYLGNYYAARNEMARAQEIWQKLVKQFAPTKEGDASVWAELAQTRLH